MSPTQVWVILIVTAKIRNGANLVVSPETAMELEAPATLLSGTAIFTARNKTGWSSLAAPQSYWPIVAANHCRVRRLQQVQAAVCIVHALLFAKQLLR